MFSSSARKRLVIVFAFILCVVAAAAVRFGSVTVANTAAPVLVPIITATNNDALLTDVDLDGRADPGDTIEYTVIIANGAPAGAGNDATGVIFTDTLSSNMTLVPGSVNSSPIVNNESFSVTGNVRIQVPDGASDLLGNDVDPDTLNNTGLTASGGTTSAQGGNVSVNANGSFSYNPPAGFEGTDTFTYTVTDPNGNTGTGTVTFNVSGMVWFINNNSPACTTLAAGCGRLTNPFSTLAAFVALNNGAGSNPGANDNIFVFESAAAYTGGVTLLSGQKLFGQDSTSTLAALTGITLPSFSDAFPAMNPGGNATTIQNAGGNGVTLSSGNTLNGFTGGDASATAISGSSFGTVTVDNVIINNTTGQAIGLNAGTFAGTGFTSVTSTGGVNNVSLTTVAGTLALGTGALSGASSTAFSVTGGTAAITYSGTISKTSAGGQVVSIGTHGTGNITLSGNLTCNGGCTGINATGNTSGTITFSGGTKTINTGTLAAVTLATNTGATINFSGGGLDIDTTSGAGFSATGGGTVSVTTGANPNAIDSATGTALNVANTTIGASGLTFRSISASGGASGIILNATGNGFFTVTGDGTTTRNNSGGTINVTGTAISLTDAANVQLDHVAVTGAGADGVFGTLITDEDGAGGAPSFAYRHGSIANQGDAVGEHSFDFETLAAANVTGSFVIDNVLIQNFGAGAVSVTNNSGTLTGSVNNSQIDNNHDTIGETGIEFRGTGTAIINSNVQNNDMTDVEGSGISILNEGNQVNDTNVINNRISRLGGPDSFPTSPGININVQLNATVTFDIQSNAVRHCGGDGFVLVAFGSAEGRIGGSTPALGNTFANLRTGDGVRIDVGDSTDANPPVTGKTWTVLVQNNDIGIDNTGLPTPPPTVPPNSPGLGDDGIQILHRNTSSTLNLTILNNDINQTTSEAVRFFTDEDTASVVVPISNVRIADNVLTNISPAIPDDEMILVTQDTATASFIITGNNNGGAGTFGAIFFTITAPSTASITQASLAALSTANDTANTTPVGSSTPTFNSGAPNPPLPTNSIAPPSGDNEKNLSFLNKSQQTPSDILAMLKPFDKYSESNDWSASSVSFELSAEREKASEINLSSSKTEAVTPLSERSLQAGTLALQSFLSDATGFIGEGLDKLGAAILPTAEAQNTKEIPVQISGETISVGSPTGFTLPATKSITIKFRATVNNTPIGLTQVSNQGTVSGSNFSNVLTDDTAVGGGADPTVTLIDSTTITVSSSQNPSITGQSMTFTATLVGAPVHATGDPGGTVQFFDNGVALGAPQTVAAGTLNDNTGTATLTLSNLTAATHPITATYSGGGTGPGGFNANNTSNTLNQVVSNTAVWDGSTSAAWADGTNWTTNGAPSLATNDVSIPAAGVTNNPTISAADVTVNNLTLSTGRTLTINTNRTLNINGLLTMNGNNIDASGGFVAFGPGGTVTRTSGSILGNVDKQFTAAGAFNYPVGTATGYSPVSVNITALATNPSTLRILANDGTAPAVPVLADAMTLDRYWSLTETGDLTADVVFNYLEVDVDGTETNYKTIRVTGTTAISLPNGVPCPGGGSPCVDAVANTITVNGLQAFSNWTAGELSPTAANVSIGGRVFDATGRAVANAQLSMIDENGNARLARTNPFGYYRFEGVQAGSDYTVNVSHKLHNFTPRFISVTEDLTELNFIASP